MIERLRYDGVGELLRWAEARTPTGHPFREDARTIGIEVDGDVRAVVVFDTFSPWDCQVHICADGRHWPIRSLVIACGAFAFGQCGYRRVGAQISRLNRPALSLAYAMGFRREGILRRAGMSGEGMVQLSLLREECRWMPLGVGLSVLAPRQLKASPL